MKRPSFQFYPADWRKDLELQSCSIAARGLWHEMMCVMHEAEPYGYLVLNGRPMTDAQAATACRVTPQQYRSLLSELKEAGVPGVSEEGAIFSRRMVRDESIREARAAGGEAGAEHGKKGAKDGYKGGRPRKERGVKKPPLYPPPSSSSSSSEKNKGAFAPPDWVPIDLWNAWLEVRRKKRAPNTDEALRLSVLDLERFKAAGHEPRTVLEQSVKRGWQGLFETKATTLFQTADPQSSARVLDLGNCACGSPATLKVGGKPRCAEHVKGYEEAA